jgi:hypothetical protein
MRTKAEIEQLKKIGDYKEKGIAEVRCVYCLTPILNKSYPCACGKGTEK